MAYVGCDLSTHNVDLVKLDEESDRAEWVRVPLVGENAVDRARSYRLSAYDVWSSAFWDDVILCALEDPAGRGDTRKIARVQGVVIATIPARVQVWTLQPAEWRKACAMPGNCPKERVRLFAEVRLQDADSGGDFERWPQDAYDAYAVAYAARAINASAASVAEGDQTQEEAA